MFAVVVKGFVKLAEKRRFNEGVLDDKEARVDEGVAFEPPPPPPPEEEPEEGDVMGWRKGFGLMDDEAEKDEIGDVGVAEDEGGPEKPNDVDMDRWRGSEIESGAVFVVFLLV
jgi:hypothetical protein